MARLSSCCLILLLPALACWRLWLQLRYSENAQLAHVDAYAVYLYDSEKDSIFFGEDECFIPGKKGLTLYRYPLKTFPMNEAAAVVGVLSTGNRPHERNWVRQSWAQGRTNVFFLVAGDWTKSLEREFRRYNDVIWIDEPEAYRGITVKVVVWLSAVNKHIPDAFVVKTDDDSYVRMIELESLAKTRQAPLYLGFGCDLENWVVRDPENPWYVSPDIYEPEKFPKYAYGGGYLLSPNVNKCAVQRIQQRLNDKEVFPIEDVFVGVLVHGCENAGCAHDHRFKTYSIQEKAPDLVPKDVKNAIILHQIKSYDVMLAVHREACCKAVEDGFMWDETSCFHVDCTRS